MEAPITAAPMRLSDEHRAHLLASGVSEDVITERGYWSAHRGQHGEFLRALQLGSFVNSLPGLIVPIWGLNGEQTSSQLRLDIAPAGMRYKSPARAERPVTLDVHPRSVGALADASVDLWITEGVKKADAATSVGLCCVALMGVTMWTKKDDKGNVTALPEWDAIGLQERNVYIAFDSDVTTKPPVQKALVKLKTFLEGRGAFVHTVYLPNAEDGSKVGLDDFLAAGQSATDLYQLPQFLGKNEYSNPKLLDLMNKSVAVLQKPVGNFLFESDGEFQICTLSDLRTEFGNVQGVQNVDAATWWSKQPGRRTYKDIVFAPGRDTEPEGRYNLWKGWALEPKQRDMTLFWDFVREIICANDEIKYVYLRKWMAFAVQKPSELPKVALLLHSDQGTGKGMFMDWFKRLFGRHYFEVTSLDNAIGHFNAHLGTSLLTFANEAVWGGDKKQQSRLKALITDATSDVTSKGKDTVMIANFKRWVFASNADNPIPIERSDRRFVIFEVSTARVGQTDYYRALENLREREGGPEGLFYDLLHEDISEFNPAVRPTSGSSRYKHLSASPFEQWLQGVLNDAEIRRQNPSHGDCYTPWERGLIGKNALYDAFKVSCRGKRGDVMTDTSFWVKMRELGLIDGDVRKLIDGARIRCVNLVDIDAARAVFSKHMGDDGTMWEHAESVPPPCEKCEADREMRDRPDGPF